MTREIGLIIVACLAFAPPTLAGSTEPSHQAGDTVEIPLDVLADKIQGGLLGQILGNLNGLPFEAKFIDEPGNVREYAPGLPDGARTDDDTDLEWLYVVEMQRSGRTLLEPERIVRLWKTHVNSHIWCANRYARSLMDLGLQPPLTGRIALNPWAEFNISGQFVTEAFGLISPGMPQTAGKIGLHYTHVAIDGEPAQATQLFAGMIAMSFFQQDVHRIVEGGLASLDPRSALADVVRNVQRFHRESPADWRTARRKIRDRYTRVGGDTRDRNGHELNTAAVIGSLLYGNGDLVETLRLAFNFGWDADCNAATAGTIVGVIKGRRWMEQQGWPINDRYANLTRPGMPEDETISGYGRRLVELARRIIRETGGEEIDTGGTSILRIARQQPVNVEPLPRERDRTEELRRTLTATMGAASDDASRARAAYLAFCLGESEGIQAEQPESWRRSIAALKTQTDLLKLIARLPSPSGDRLIERFDTAGLLPIKRPTAE